MSDTTLHAATADLPHDITTTFKGNASALNEKVVEGQILAATMAQLSTRPGFNPAAISVVFGLKW
jgi:hypothetical protein